MKALIVIFALLLAPIAHAGIWSLECSVFTNHFEDRGKEDWNESTTGCGMRYAFDSVWAAQAGRYVNEFSVRSHEFSTNYIGVDYTPWAYGPLRLGGYGWLTTGYDAHVLAPSGSNAQPSTVVASRSQGVLPAIGLEARVEYGVFSYTLRVHPNLPGAVPAAMMSFVGVAF